MAGNIPGERKKAGRIRVVIFTALRIFNLHYQPVVFTLERKMQEQCFSLFQQGHGTFRRLFFTWKNIQGRIYIYIYWCILNLIKSQDHTSGVTFHFNFFLLSIKYKLLKIHELNKSIPIIFKNKHRNNLSMRPVLSFCQIINLTASEFLQSLLNLHASFFLSTTCVLYIPNEQKKTTACFLCIC